MSANPSTFSIDLSRPVEAVAHTGRLSAVTVPAQTRFRDLDLGLVQVRLVRMDAIRFDRSARFTERVPHRHVLLHLVSGGLTGEFGGLPFRMGAGDSVLQDTSHPGRYQCGDGTLLLGLSIDAAALPDVGHLRAVAPLASTPLVEATISFLLALSSDRREESIGTAEGRRIAEILTGLMQAIVTEHRRAAA